MKMTKAIQKGFTLIEIMIVVAIIGIIASIAIPSYTDYVMRGHITSATSELSSMRAEMEQFYQDERTYTGAPKCKASNVGKFTMGCAVTNGGNGYSLTATGTGPVSGFSYSLDEQNTMASATPWGSSSSCWVTGRGQAC